MEKKQAKRVTTEEGEWLVREGYMELLNPSPAFRARQQQLDDSISAPPPPDSNQLIMSALARIETALEILVGRGV